MVPFGETECFLLSSFSCMVDGGNAAVFLRRESLCGNAGGLLEKEVLFESR